MSRNIALAGMMGAGKSTVAALLGQRLGRRVVDTDEEITRWRQTSIPEIFATEGEAAFRRYEQTVVRELAKVNDLVLSLGGGVVLNDDNVADLVLTGVIVLLDAPAEALIERLQEDDGGRPLIADDPEHRITTILNRRRPRYTEVADLVVDASQHPDDVVADILGWCREKGDILTPSELERTLP